MICSSTVYGVVHGNAHMTVLERWGSPSGVRTAGAAVLVGPVDDVDGGPVPTGHLEVTSRSDLGAPCSTRVRTSLGGYALYG